MGLYHYHRLDCCSNVFSSLGLAGGTKLAIAAFHANVLTAEQDFVRFYKSVMEISPYFRKQYNSPPIRFIAASSKTVGGVIGTQLIYCERMRSSKIISKCWKLINSNQQEDLLYIFFNDYGI